VTLEGEALRQLRKRAQAGGSERYHAANAAKGKLFARERIALLIDEGSFAEDGLYANAMADGLPADGVVTGSATVDGRPVWLMANDSTVKAGSWGARTVEKIIRAIERAYATGVPMIYLVDSAGARITDQVDLFPGRRGAGRIFWNQVRASGSVPQVCALFGPSAAGGAYIPAFCDVVAMVDGNASMYLGSDRMVEMVTGEKTTLEAMGGARVHCAESGVGHFLCKTEAEALDVVRRYLSYLPSNWQETPPAAEGGQQLAAQGRRPLRRLGRQGDPLRAAVRRVQRPAAVPRRRAGFHGRRGGGEAGHHPPRRQDDYRDLGGDRAEGLRRGPQGLRCRALRDGRSGLRPRRHHRPAHRIDRRDGRRGRRERGLSQ
jgi:acetyl-CoA carboxylase carboxyltransferase component